MGERTEAAAKAVWPLITLLVPLALVSVLVAGSSASIEASVIQALINLVIVVGLYVFIGNSGVLSFGHVGFVAVGAYTAALLTIPLASKEILLPSLPHFLAVTELSTVPAILVAAAVAGIFAFLVGVALMRLSGIAASIATLSLLVIVTVVLTNWDAITAGQGTLTGLPVDTTLGTALVWACIVCVVAYVYQRSRSGLLLRAARDDEVAARSLGIPVLRQRVVSFALSAMIVAIGGALYGHFLGSLTPSALYLQLTFSTLAMLVVGGLRSLSGAVLGTAVVSALYEVVLRLQDGRGIGPITVTLKPGIGEMIIAALVILILIVRPAGITGGREVPWPFRRKTSKESAPAPHEGASTQLENTP